jgi:hypothetical protein
MDNLQSTVNNLEAKIKELEDAIVANGDAGVMSGWIPGGGSGGLTYDYVYVGGKRLAVPEKTSNYLKVYLDGTTAPEWVSAMPETPDSNAEVFDVTKNRIHLPGNFAGG